MPIAALSDKTKQLLGSTSTITDPVSLVKELLDNAFDANATTIEVLISHNTVDKIEVRDNGTGIHPDDYNYLGRRGYTSKLRTFDDLQSLAGTLGFRGEALSSANTLGKITITTKTESDSVAAVLHIDPKDGGILKQDQIAAPVGTTVCVSQLFYEVPVRRQVALKEAKKAIEKIRGLFFSYVMARPQIKMIFKVYKHPALGWSYSPRPSTSFKEAIFQTLGKEAASRCFEKKIRLGGSLEDTTDAGGSAKGPFVFEVVLWKPDAEFLRLPKHRYFSVDSRPVTGVKGTMKKLMAIYIKYLGNSLHPPTDSKALSDAFIRVNIDCPRGSYDVTIEPAKDDLLFENEHDLIQHFEALCQQVYTNPDVGMVGTEKAAKSPEIERADPTQEPASAPSSSTSGWTAINTTVVALPETPGDPSAHISHPPEFSSTMSDDLCELVTASKEQGKGIPAAPGIKRNAAMRRDSTELGQREKMPISMGFTSAATINNQQNQMPHGSRFLPEQGLSDQEMKNLAMTPEPEILLHRGAPPRDLDVPPSMRMPDHHNLGRDVTSDVRNSPMSLQSDSSQPLSIGNNIPSRRQPLPTWTPPSSVQKDPQQWQERYQKGSRTRSNGKNQTTIAFGGRKDSDAPRGNQEQGHSQPQNVGPVRKSIENEIYHLSRDAQSQLSDENHRSSQMERDVARPHKPVPQQSAQGLPDRNNFTRLRSTEVHNNDESITDKAPIITSLETGDPRAYLLRRQKSVAADENMGRPKKHRRMKSILLPLENIVKEDQTRELELPYELHVSRFPTLLDHFGQSDRYIVEGDIEEALDMDLSEARRIEKRFDDVLSRWNEAHGVKVAVKSGLSSVLKGDSAGLQ
ncbi:hypothetical protein KJ359_012034 [Pestalotiopsis sp. 9143b]|nr:hypothetical protein KJ359_012034 [Pestalotiopsis sp. 9143b]